MTPEERESRMSESDELILSTYRSTDGSGEETAKWCHTHFHNGEQEDCLRLPCRKYNGKMQAYVDLKGQWTTDD